MKKTSKKKVSKKEYYLVKGTVFPFDILITLFDDDKLIKFIEKTMGYELDQEEKNKLPMNGVGRSIMLKGGQTIIRLRKEKTILGYDLPTLAHEIEHAIFFIMDKVGIKHTEDSDEVFAYYQAYVLRECLENFKAK